MRGMTTVPWPTAGRAWYVAGLLCLIAALSYLDRYIIALLADPIIKDMGIDATAIGLLIGLGFGLLYALSGMPVAYLIDRGTRVRIVGIGVIMWSLSTIASGFAPNFETLLMTRAGVAIGEAVLVPATVSIVADLFPPERRALPIGLFMAVSTLMAAGAFLIGAYAFELATLLSSGFGLSPWRMTLVIVGVPGLLLGPLWLLTVAEPDRVEAQGQADQTTIAVAFAYLRRNWRFYLPFYLSFGVSALASYSFIAWTATMLTRSYGQTIADAGQIFGVVGVIAGAVAALFWPALSARAMRRGRPAFSVLALAIGLGIGNAAVAAFLLASDLDGAIAIIAIATFGYGAAGGLAVLILQHIAPPRMRAKITSLYVLVGNLVGLTCGPGLSAWMSDSVFQGTDALRQSLSVLALIMLPLTVGLILLAMTAHGRVVEEADR
jgi:MFS family permease